MTGEQQVYLIFDSNLVLITA